MKLKNDVVKALERILQVPFTVTKKSSRIYALGYNSKKLELYVVFARSFDIYKYAGVPENTWMILWSAARDVDKSIGKLFQEYIIKPQYPYVRCELTRSSQNKKK